MPRLRRHGINDTNVSFNSLLSTRVALAMTPSTIKGRPGGRTAEVAAKIFKATMGLLEAGGFTAVTYQAVAERAGVGRATLYRRWPDTATLVADAIQATAAERIEIADTGSLQGDLSTILHQIGVFISSPTGAATLVAVLNLPLREGDDGRGPGWTQRWAEVEPIFARARLRGEWREDADAEVLFATLAGALYFRRIVMGRQIDRRWIDAVLDQSLNRSARDR